MQSGNLNYSIPLLKPQARGGWGPAVSLSYNSQMWRYDGATGTNWLLGTDVGYGLGWKLMAGSLQVFRDSYWSVHHYLFTDGTGAEYRLDASYPDGSNRKVWRTTKDSVYMRYEEDSNRLYFPDGSFWLMDVVAAGLEQDAGTRYPSRMQDRNGNWIRFVYGQGNGAGWTNSSGRTSDRRRASPVDRGSADDLPLRLYLHRERPAGDSAAGAHP
jgi:hypothetical protein